MNRKFDNSKQRTFLKSLEAISLDDDDNTLARRCKFNFSYYTLQEGKTGFEVWEKQKLLDFIEKLKHFSTQSLSHWTQMPIGRGSGKVLAIYEAFPKRSNYLKPISVPHQARWARFRLDRSCRLCGFLIPEHYNRQTHKNGFTFDSNTFYIVFIDDNHGFYLTGD